MLLLGFIVVSTMHFAKCRFTGLKPISDASFVRVHLVLLNFVLLLYALLEIF
jgi:hypothetical protein